MFIFCLCYPMVLIIINAVYAIKIRKVPAGFNEAKHIVFAVYITLVLWVAQASLAFCFIDQSVNYLLCFYKNQISTFVANTSTDIVLRDALYCLGVSMNSLVILFAIFGPKIYIIIFRPAKNNEQTVMANSCKFFSFKNL